MKTNIWKGYGGKSAVVWDYCINLLKDPAQLPSLLYDVIRLQLSKKLYSNLYHTEEGCFYLDD